MTLDPATEDDVCWAARLAAQTYSGLDVIPESVMVGWYRANPTGFSVIRTDGGERIGNFDILPLKPDTLERFAAGDLIEREIRGEWLYGPAESSRIRDLYIESFVCRNALAAGRALRMFPRLAARICDPRQVSAVYAIAASGKGERLAGHLGFEALRPAPARRDGHQLLRAGYESFVQGLYGRNTET